MKSINAFILASILISSNIINCMKNDGALRQKVFGGRLAQIILKDATNKELHKIKNLLEANQSINVNDDNARKAFFLYCISGKAKIIELFLKNGFDINMPDEYGNTVLMYVVFHGFREKIQFLIDKGAKANISNKNGENALYWAEFFGYDDIIKLLK